MSRKHLMQSKYVRCASVNNDDVFEHSIFITYFHEYLSKCLVFTIVRQE